MPREIRVACGHAPAIAPYPTTVVPGQRNAAIWSTGDDEILLQARASGLNWQSISNRHFPSKTANACRKRHERLIERRHVEDWDAQKLELLAQEYVACRREMWEMLAARVGERWAIVEAKCMEKGLKTLQSTVRTAQRKGAADQQRASFDERGISDHNSDSGIGLGSDTEVEAGQQPAQSGHSKSASWHARTDPQQADHVRSRSLPQPLPLYQPPPRIVRARPTIEGAEMTTSPQDATMPTSLSRWSPESNGRGGYSIHQVLAPEPET